MKKLQFLLDVNVSSTVRRFLSELGHRVKSVADFDPKMDDEAILHRAYRENEILITCDKDFGNLIFNKGLPHKGVIRLEDTTPQRQIVYLSALLEKHSNELSNSVVVAQGGVIRIRAT